MTDNVEALLTPAQVGEWVGMTTAALAQQRYLGRGPEYLKLGPKAVRYRTAAVEAWLVACQRTRTDDRPASPVARPSTATAPRSTRAPGRKTASASGGRADGGAR